MLNTKSEEGTTARTPRSTAPSRSCNAGLRAVGEKDAHRWLLDKTDALLVSQCGKDPCR
jgi:hypothetical protein